MSRSPRRPSLRRRVLTTVAGGMLLAGVTVAALAVVSLRLRTQLLAESREIREEQRIADQIFGGVSRQLALVAQLSASLDPAFRRSFEAAGFAVHEGLRTYLFRDLSAEERIQVERIKERHQAMEVSALLTVQLLGANAAAESAGAGAQLREQVNGLLDAVGEFLEMRSAEAAAVEARLSAMVRRLWLAAAGSVLLLGAVVSLMLARFLSERVTTPLAALTAAASRIGDGDLAVRVPTDHDSEFVGLATEFNQMTGRLAAAQQVLASRNRELEDALEQLHLPGRSGFPRPRGAL
jgi:methyl-accepting chemotaxis protein